MISPRKTWLTPRWLGILGLCLFFLVALISTSRTATAILLNLVPALLFVGIPAVIVCTAVVHFARRANATVVGKSVEDRLDELERLKRRDMVTPEEYAAKRQEILKDL